jgi:adenine-specific DNA methylase
MADERDFMIDRKSEGGGEGIDEADLLELQAILEENQGLREELEKVKNERDAWRQKWLKERDRARDLQSDRDLKYLRDMEEICELCGQKTGGN